jgi:hypothetical protein
MSVTTRVTQLLCSFCEVDYRSYDTKCSYCDGATIPPFFWDRKIEKSVKYQWKVSTINATKHEFPSVPFPVGDTTTARINNLISRDERSFVIRLRNSENTALFIRYPDNTTMLSIQDAKGDIITREDELEITDEDKRIFDSLVPSPQN